METTLINSDTIAQKKLILAALQKGEKLTPLDALRRFGCLRLGARCWDLRQEGHNIKTEMIAVPKTKKRIGQYSLIKDAA